MGNVACILVSLGLKSQKSLVVLEPRPLSPNLGRPETGTPMRAKRTNAYTRIGVREMRGQVPGTTRGGTRTKSAINNTQAH